MLRTIRLQTILAPIAILVALSGCSSDMMYPTIGDVKQIQDKGFDALDKHDNNMTEQHAVMRPELASELRGLRANFTVDLEDLRKEVQELESNLKPLIDQGAAVLGNLLAKFTGIDLPLGELFNQQEKSTNNKVATLVADTQSRIKSIEDRMKDVESTLRDRIADVADDVDHTNAKLVERFNSFDQAFRDKLTSASDSLIDKLKGLEQNDAEFRSTLKNELQLTDAEMEKLKDLTPTEILALLGVGGVGTAASRFGPSRNKKEVDDAKKDANDAKSEAKTAIAKADALAAVIETLRKP